MKFSGIHIDHPRGKPSVVTLAVDRELKSGKLDLVPLGEDDLIRLIAEAADKLRILRART